jgi:hypothetical protein
MIVLRRSRNKRYHCSAARWVTHVRAHVGATRRRMEIEIDRDRSGAAAAGTSRFASFNLCP